METVSGNPAEPLVSVIIPTYERRDLVVEAVRSVLRQTWGRGSFEVIVVDDGSTDGTAAALSALPGPLRCIRQDNQGVASARNAGIAAAKGSIVAFLDSDNLWLADHLQTIVQAFEQFPTAVLACTSPHLRRSSADRARLVDPLPRQLYSPWVRFTSTVAIRSEILASVGGFDESLPTNEDGDLCLRVALLGPFAVVPRRTVRIRKTQGSFWQRSRASGAFLEADERIVTKFLEEVTRSPAPSPQVIEAARGRLSLNRAYRGIAADDPATARAALAEACRAIPELSSDPESVARRLSINVPGRGEPRELARTYALAADLWPERDCDTALVLRCCAVLESVRAKDLRQAAVQTSRLPLARMAALSVRRRSLIGRVARERARSLLLRGSEVPAPFTRARGTERDTLGS